MWQRKMIRGRANPRRIHKTGLMNGMEREYAAILDAEVSAGFIAGFYFERVTLKLADDTRYTPDFMVILSSGEVRFDEVKGWMEDDAWVKFKVASEMFPFSFRLARKRTRKSGGGWEVKDYPRNENE